MSPIQLQRNKDISIVSIIQFHCNDSLSMNIQWTINSCLSNCSSKIPINSTVITTFSELYIPSQTLDCGIYELKLTVTMLISSNLRSTVSAFIKIIPSDIIVNLVQSESSMISIGYNQNLTLNPGIYSIDLSGYEFNASVSKK